jgi:tetratricopeptide (TPR) repeat protein
MLPLFLVIVAAGIDLLGVGIEQCIAYFNKNAFFLPSLARANLIFITTAMLLFGGVGMKPLGKVVTATSQLPDWRGVSRFLKTHAVPGDTIVLLPYTADYQSFTYYYKPLEENTTVISLEWDLVSQLKTLPIRSVWWVIPTREVDSAKWKQAGFSSDSFGGLIVLQHAGSVSFEKIMDEATLILDYALKQDIESNLNYGTLRSQALLNSALASLCYAQTLNTENAECDAYFQTALNQFIAFRELAGGVTSIGVDDAWDFKGLNRLALRIDQAEALESLYNQWNQEWPDRQGPHRLLAEWYLAKGQLEAAVMEYKLAIAAGKGATTGDHMALAQVYEALGEMDNAIATYHQQFELYGVKRIEVARALFRLSKSQGIPYATRIEIYEEALKKLFFDVEVYRDLGSLYLENGNWPRAEALFRRAAWMNPSLAWPHRGLGSLYLKQGLADKGISEFQQAIEKEPFRPGAYAELASWYETQANNQKTIQVYELAIQNNSRFAWPFLALGDFYVREGVLQKAIAAYQEAVETEPWNQDALDSLHNMQWDLAANLGLLEVYTTNHTPLTWWVDSAWVRPYPDPPDTLVGRSALSVGGLVRPDQVHLHPFGPQQDTSIRFKVKNSMYAALQIGYGLADQTAGFSNGVQYSIQISLDNGNSYIPLFDETVTDSIWLSQTLSLIPYLGEDVTFQLTVDALGNDTYDWLQTSLHLAPVVNTWDLSTHLDIVRAANMDWNGANAWVDKNSRPLITVSKTPVQGMARENQVQFHPFSTHQESSIIFDVKHNPYVVLKTKYALADESIGRSNGADYAILISTDGGQSYSNLLKRQVLQNSWDAVTLDLSAYLNHDLKFLLLASSKGDDTYDWLQITLDLISPAPAQANGF